MTNIRARNLFTAILVARAICGLGVAQAGYVPGGETPGGGLFIVGSLTVSDLASYLTEGPSYNDVTLDNTASSGETLPFVNISGDVLGNSLTNQGYVYSTSGAGVLFSGDSVSDNTLSNSGTIGSYTSDGIQFNGSKAISDNTIDNSGSITATYYDDMRGIALLALNDGPDAPTASSITGNSITVDPSGSITAANDGIYLGVSDDSNDNLTTITGNTVVNDGAITSKYGSGILFEAGFDNSTNTVTNNGSIRSNGAGISLISVDGDVNGNIIINDVSGNIAGYSDPMATVGIVLGSQEGDATDNTVTNRGQITADYVGVHIYGNESASGNTIENEAGASISGDSGILIYGRTGVEGNIVTNNGDINANSSSGYNEAGIGLFSGTGSMSGNTVTNDVSGNITSNSDGIALRSVYYSSGDLIGNTVINDGAIFADDAGILLGSGHDVSGNTVTNSGGIIGGGNYSEGIVLGASHDILGNVITNASTARISVHDDGVVLSSYHDIAGNTVNNIGHIFNYDGDGIVLSARNDVSGNTITNGPRPVDAVYGDANFWVIRQTMG